MAKPVTVKFEPRDDLAEDIRTFKIGNGTRYYSGDGQEYVVTNLRRDGALTLRRATPKARGKARRKAEKRARHDAGALTVKRTPMKLPQAVKDIRTRFVAAFGIPKGTPETIEALARDWSIKFAQQVVYELPGQGWGVKKASETRPIGKDTIANNQGGLKCWDLFTGTGTGNPTLNDDPESESIPDQVFVEVSPLNSLPVPSQGINLETVKVLGSPAECLEFPIAAHLRNFSLVPGTMTLESSGAEAWPAVAIEAGGEPAQAATLWIFLKIAGQWYATGAERLRPNQVNGSKPEADAPGAIGTLVGGGWLYDPNRWGVMAGYNPKPGEAVGLMIVSGSTRSDTQTTVQQRSNVLVVAWPDNNGAAPARVLWNETVDVEPGGGTGGSGGGTGGGGSNPPVDDDLKQRLGRLEAQFAGLIGLTSHLEELIKGGDDNNERRYKDIVAHLENAPAISGSKGFTGSVNVFGARVKIDLVPKE